MLVQKFNHFKIAVSGSQNNRRLFVFPRAKWYVNICSIRQQSSNAFLFKIQHILLLCVATVGFSAISNSPELKSSR